MLLSMRCWPMGKKKKKKTNKIQNPAWNMVLFRGQIPGGTGLVSEGSEPGFQLLTTHIKAGFLCRAV